MKIIIVVGLAFLSSCTHLINLPRAEKNEYSIRISKKIMCRITYYCGLDAWGDRVACQKTKRAIYGTTVAAHPDFPFGQEIHIPALKGIIGDGNFTVQDRGSAVTKKTAARGKGYVFDVYVTTEAEMNKHARYRPMWMEVEILQKN